MEIKDISKIYFINKEMKLLQGNLSKILEERERLEKMLEEIKDPEIRLIVRLRCVNNVGWQEIGDEIGMDRRAASRKYHDFFEKLEKESGKSDMSQALLEEERGI